MGLIAPELQESGKVPCSSSFLKRVVNVMRWPLNCLNTVGVNGWSETNCTNRNTCQYHNGWSETNCANRNTCQYHNGWSETNCVKRNTVLHYHNVLISVRLSRPGALFFFKLEIAALTSFSLIGSSRTVTVSYLGKGLTYMLVLSSAPANNDRFPSLRWV